jgi:hypothetical protein
MSYPKNQEKRMTHKKNPEKEEDQRHLPDPEELARELAKAESIDDFYGKDGIFARMFSKTIEQMLEAAVHGDRQATYQALLAHPLGPEADNIQAVMDDMLNTHRQYLPKFWKT